jgi:hypothetical protein
MGGGRGRLGNECAWGLVLALAAVGALAAPARAADTLREIQFKPGKTAVKAHGHLTLGDSNIWVITARAGQTGDVRVTSIEDNVSFRIYQPPAVLKHTIGALRVEGPELPGVIPVQGLDAGAGRHWTGPLPAAGRYYVVVGSDRGNASYTLAVTIK